jgi:hypothetical protein
MPLVFRSAFDFLVATAPSCSPMKIAEQHRAAAKRWLTIAQAHQGLNNLLRCVATVDQRHDTRARHCQLIADSFKRLAIMAGAKQ